MTSPLPRNAGYRRETEPKHVIIGFDEKGEPRWATELRDRTRDAREGWIEEPHHVR
jgi:hypothetical protein